MSQIFSGQRYNGGREMNYSTEQTVDFLGYRITAVQDDDGTLYVPLNELRDIMEIAQNGQKLLSEPASTRRLLSANEVGKMLGITEQEVHELAEEDRMGYVRLTETKKAYTMELVAEFIEAETYRRSWRWDEIKSKVEAFG
jgi:hypothetical protein